MSLANEKQEAAAFQGVRSVTEIVLALWNMPAQELISTAVGVLLGLCGMAGFAVGVLWVRDRFFRWCERKRKP